MRWGEKGAAMSLAPIYRCRLANACIMKRDEYE